MARRWVICPVIESDVDLYHDLDTNAPTTVPHGDPAPANSRFSGRYRMRESKIETAHAGKFNVSQVIADGMSWCICNVTGPARNFADLDADPQIEDILEGNDINLGSTVNDLAWSDAKLTRIKSALESRGANFTGLTKNDLIWKFLTQALKVLSPDIVGPAGTWAVDPENP